MFLKYIMSHKKLLKGMATLKRKKVINPVFLYITIGKKFYIMKRENLKQINKFLR